MKKIILFSICMAASLLLSAQAPAIQWQRSLGGTLNDDVRSIKQTPDSGYILAGWSSSADSDVTVNHGGRDFWIVKTDAFGMIIWQKSYGGTLDDEANAVQLTTDGGYIVAGSSKSADGDVTLNHGNADFWVAKVDASGSLQWQKSFGGSQEDIATSVQQTTGGGYIICGNTKSGDGDVTGFRGTVDYWVVKVDSLGTLQWKKALGGSGIEDCHSIQQTPDGGYVVGGGSGSTDGDVTGYHGLYDFWLAKLSSTGALQWQKCYGGSGTDIAMSMQQTSDGGYVMSGYSMSNDGDVTGHHGSFEDWWTVKTTATGVLQWQKILGGSGSELCRSVSQAADGGYILAGPSGSNDFDFTGIHGCRDAWVAKLNAGGLLQWQKPLGGSGCEDVGAIIQTADGGYAMAAIAYVNSGDVSGNHGADDYWIVKLVSTVGVEENNSAAGVDVYPNPSGGIFYFSELAGENTITVFDQTGRLIHKVISKDSSVKINLQETPGGVYFYSVTNHSGTVKHGVLIIQ